MYPMSVQQLGSGSLSPCHGASQDVSLPGSQSTALTTLEVNTTHLQPLLMPLLGIQFAVG